MSNSENRGGFRPGAGRKPKYGEVTVSVGIHLPRSLRDELRYEAAQANRSLSEHIYRILLDR